MTENSLKSGITSKRKLIEDIKPVPVKDRSALGIVEITLDGGHTVKAVGVVYGMEHHISGKGFDAHVFLDWFNQRIKILSYQATDFESMILRVRALAEANGFDKIICMARHRDWQMFLSFGYVLEALIKYYHDGEDAYAVSKFRSQDRLSSANLMAETLLIEEILHQPKNECVKELPSGFTISMAKRSDIQELLSLYCSIFETYPSPLIHQNYLETIFQKESLFAVCRFEGKIVAAASAELNPSARAAELTDCATKKEARGLGIMSHLLLYLEKELLQRDYRCAYTMARAPSFGMNSVFYQLGYEFTGRMVNNCDIYGAYEDMNIWVRNLRPAQESAPQ